MEEGKRCEKKKVGETNLLQTKKDKDEKLTGENKVSGWGGYNKKCAVHSTKSAEKDYKKKSVKNRIAITIGKVTFGVGLVVP